MKRLIEILLPVILACTFMQCRKPVEPEPEKPEKYVFGRVVDRTDNTIVPNCLIGLYEIKFDGAFDRYTRIMETKTGADGKYEFHFTRKAGVNKYCFTIDEAPDGFAIDDYLPGFRNFIAYNTLKKNSIQQDITTVSYGSLKVRFIGDGTANKVVFGGGGTPTRFYHGCDTIAWWSNESGKLAGFSYSVFGPTDTTRYEINDIMIKFGTVYKEVHF